MSWVTQNILGSRTSDCMTIGSLMTDMTMMTRGTRTFSQCHARRLVRRTHKELRLTKIDLARIHVFCTYSGFIGKHFRWAISRSGIPCHTIFLAIPSSPPIPSPVSGIYHLSARATGQSARSEKAGPQHPLLRHFIVGAALQDDDLAGAVYYARCESSAHLSVLEARCWYQRSRLVDVPPVVVRDGDGGLGRTSEYGNRGPKG